jgi:hypothetical protein
VSSFFFRGCRVLRMSTSHISTADLHKRPMFGRSVAIYYYFCLLSVISTVSSNSCVSSNPHTPSLCSVSPGDRHTRLLCLAISSFYISTWLQCATTHLSCISNTVPTLRAACALDQHVALCCRVLGSALLQLSCYSIIQCVFAKQGAA